MTISWLSGLVDRAVPITKALWLAAIFVLGAPAALRAQGAGHMDHMGSHMHDGPHMRFTDLRAPSGDDETRARALLERLSAAIGKYRDADAALAEGFQPFLPTVPQEVYHFVHYPATGAEYAGGPFDPTRPGSLLYEKSGGKHRLVGAMYSAPAHFTPEELHARVPLSFARWHAHVNVCLPEGITLDDLARGEIGAAGAPIAGTLDGSQGGFAQRMNQRYGFLADGRFGFEGRIADGDACAAAGGHFLPQAYGWMVHVYPFAGDDLSVAYGLEVPE